MTTFKAHVFLEFLALDGGKRVSPLVETGQYETRELLLEHLNALLESRIIRGFSILELPAVPANLQYRSVLSRDVSCLSPNAAASPPEVIYRSSFLMRQRIKRKEDGKEKPVFLNSLETESLEGLLYLMFDLSTARMIEGYRVESSRDDGKTFEKIVFLSGSNSSEP